MFYDETIKFKLDNEPRKFYRYRNSGEEINMFLKTLKEYISKEVDEYFQNRTSLYAVSNSICTSIFFKRKNWKRLSKPI